jgi:class 3 adenylate cyclase
MTDVEDSSKCWSSDAAAMRDAVSRLDRTAAACVGAAGGCLLKARGEGDSHFAVFDRPSDAVRAAIAWHAQLCRADAGVRDLELRVRCAVHVGEAAPTDVDYYGIVVNQTARLRATAHGGQTVLSRAAADLARPALDGDVQLKSLGYHRIRDFARLEEVFQADSQHTDLTFPPLRTGESRGPAVLSIALVDVCGARALLRDRHDIAQLQRTWAATLHTTAQQHQAITLKLLGDGCLAAFDDPLDALAFVASLAESFTTSRLAIRAGIDTGRVELADGEIIGDAVLAAADLCHKAAPGETLITEAVRNLAGPSASTAPAT